MASGLFLLLDDIAMLADDVAIASKMATQKTAAILGDDLAVNAQKATGFDQSRELAILWAITKGSLKNKFIILPIAFLLTAFAPYLITYILIGGAIYILYEGAEKIEETLFAHHHNKHEEERLLDSTQENILDIEKEKIASAILTDFILSIEIIVIALASVADKALSVQITSTIIVALLATFGVYGFVALIVRMDNLGLWLMDRKLQKSGLFLIHLMPKVIKSLAFIGVVAMILVGGGILMHNITPLHHFAPQIFPQMANEAILGLLVGAVAVIMVKVYKVIKK